jgi:hypothetical protein
MKLGFRTLATVSALLFFSLALVWLMTPTFFLSDWGIDYSAAVAVIGRRAAALYAGIGSMFLFARNAEPSVARTALLRGAVVTSLLLAALGVYELKAGNVSPQILAAVVVEVSITVAMLFVGRQQPLRSDAGRLRGR